MARPAVAGLATTACVRVRDVSGEVVGSGFLVSTDLVATCAHVVAAALRSDPYDGEPPATAVTIDFPTVAGGPVQRSARVHRWVPIAEDGTGDVAVLRLAEPAPAGAVMPPLRRVDRLWDHAFHVFGFPDGRWDGVWSTGRIRGGQGTGWYQLQSAAGDQRIEGGFSGAPVWDADTGAVVGMTVAADRDPDVTTAYLLPVEHVLGLDPELLPSPYRGLEPFDEEHAEYFFGRAPEIERLVTAVGANPVVVVAGPSGAGKSSLVKAGLLPRLRREGIPVAQVRARLGTPVLEEVDAALRERDGAARVRRVLLVDQFEELADADAAAARELLAALVAVATADGSRVRVVLTMRGTAIDEILTPDAADALGSGSVFVGPLDRARLRAAVVGPAERAPGLAFEDGLVDRILDEAGTEPGQLPLVESLLAQLWERREGGALTVRGYEEAGGVAGALAAHAERVVAVVRDEVGGEARLRELCVRLATTARDGRVLRRPVRLDELPASLHPLVAVLAAARLVVVTGTAGGGTVELAHQSLIDHWPRLRGWLAADREFLEWRSDLDAARERWEESGRDEGALLRGAALETAGEWMAERPADLGAGQAEYVRRSRVRQRREVRRWRVVAAVLAVLVLTASVLAVVAVRRGDQVAAQLATANAGSLAREALARQRIDPVLAAELALAAWRSDPEVPVVRTALADAYRAMAGAESVVHTDPAGQPGHSVLAGDEVLVLGDDAGVHLLTGIAGPALQPWVPLDPAQVRFAFLGVGESRIALLTTGGELGLWDVGASAPAVELAGPAGSPRSPRLAADRARLSWVEGPESASVLRVHDLRTGTTSTAPVSLPAGTFEASLTADRGLVVVRTRDGLTLRSLSTGAVVRTLPATAALGGGAAYATSCPPGDRTARELLVQDVVTGEPRRVALTGFCSDAHVTGDGRYAVESLTRGSPSVAEHSRIVDLTTGAAFRFTAPSLDLNAWDEGRKPVSARPRADGGLDVYVTLGSRLVRFDARPEPPAMRGSGGIGPYVLATAVGHLVVDEVPDPPEAGTPYGANGFHVAVHDPRTGQQISRATVPGGVSLIDGDALWSRGQDDAGVWHFQRYDLPGLTPALELPPVTTAPGEDAGFAMATDGATDVVLVHAPGALTAWDARTGARLGEPVDVEGDLADMTWPREGHPGHAVVATPGQLELWDVPAGRLLGRTPLVVQNPQSVVAGPDLLVVATPEGTLEVRRLPDMTPTGPPISTPGLGELLGFDPEGRLVAVTRYTDAREIVLWDLELRAEAGRIRPVSVFGSAVAGDVLTVRGGGGNLPEVIPLRAAEWQARLCHLLPGEPSAAAGALLPAGADPSSPCD
ncbi:serine protease [Pseudonocardia zijingensis]|uniref:serine protease n=1 Tax=Pseudonocardia zijingensis TaxID=153376 RepID=UPI0031D7FAE2